MSVSINTSELRRLERAMKRLGKDYGKASQRLLNKFGEWVQGRAKELAPESPTVGDFKTMNKSGKTNRKRSGITTGSLRDSITLEKGKQRVDIGIPANSRGGKYGEKIHDQRGKTWKNLGPRSKQKGATDKFIFKAYEDGEDKQAEMVDIIIDEVIKGIGI